MRLGVAPDHENIKAVSRAFEKIAARPGFRFFGNVEVGHDVSHEELLRLYDAVVYTVGAQTDRRLGIPGEDLPGSWPATEFVAWYNGHPDFQELEFDLSDERAIVVGNGNVADRRARACSRSPPRSLRPTDTTDEAIEAIVGSGVREIVMLGRRGPVQAAFTTPELKELGELAGADVVVDPADLELDPASAACARRGPRARAAQPRAAARVRGARRRRASRAGSCCGSCVSPVAILGDGKVEAVEVVRNELVERGRPDRRAGRPTSARRSPAASSCAASATRACALPGVPFDERTRHDPERRAAVVDGRRAHRTAPAGSSAARAA